MSMSIEPVQTTKATAESPIKLQALQHARQVVDGPQKTRGRPHTWGYRVERGGRWYEQAVGSYSKTLRQMRIETARLAVACYLDLPAHAVEVYSKGSLPQRPFDILEEMIDLVACRQLECLMSDSHCPLGGEVWSRLGGDQLFQIVEASEQLGFCHADHDTHLEVADSLPDDDVRRKYLLAMIRRGGYVSWLLHERIGDELADNEWHEFVDDMVDNPRLRRAEAWTDDD